VVPNMKKVATCALVLWLGLLVSVALRAQKQQPSVAAGDDGRAVSTESGGADGARSPAWTGERRPLYRLCPSDVVEISFNFASEFNQMVTVQPDGLITLKGLEKQMYAQGMTLPELRENVSSAYASMLHEPEISIVLKDFDKPYFIAGGEVGKPGKYDLRSDTTVTEAVAIAGGFTGQAKHSQVLLFRHVSDDTVETKLLNLKAMLSGHDLKEDVHLRPGDMLFVPQNTISKIRRYLPTSSLGMYWTQRPF
jgi:protein involved in polysaccharide export with SLBB domain